MNTLVKQSPARTLITKPMMIVLGMALAAGLAAQIATLDTAKDPLLVTPVPVLRLDPIVITASREDVAAARADYQRELAATRAVSPVQMAADANAGIAPSTR